MLYNLAKASELAAAEGPWIFILNLLGRELGVGLPGFFHRFEFIRSIVLANIHAKAVTNGIRVSPGLIFPADLDAAFDVYTHEKIVVKIR